MNTIRPIEILLVEDNPGDVRLTQEALRESRILNELSVVGDGASAIDFLERRGAYASAPVPDLILLDLNLPKLSGRDVLARIKSHDEWKVIPVVVLTTSDSQKDIHTAYSLHVNCYVTKPLEFQPFMEVIKQIEDFWLTIVRLPSATPAI
jgi:chemotaxis family two-component system response regulator Rcp1